MKTELRLALLSIISFIGICVVYFFLPETIAIHWDASGRANEWGNKLNILWLGAMPLILSLSFRYLPRFDPRYESYARHRKAWVVFQVLIVSLMAVMSWLVAAIALGLPLNVSFLARLGAGLLFIGTGNFIGQLKPNYSFGIKTPWALADEEVWRRTHRRGAWVFVAMGLAFLASLAVPEGLLLAGLLFSPVLGAAYLYAYSYLAFRAVKAEKRSKNENHQENLGIPGTRVRVVVGTRGRCLLRRRAPR